MMPGVRLENISKSFGSEAVLQSVSLDIADGEFAVIVGPSGCGKSTLLRLLAGLEPADAGDIEIGGRRVNDLAPARRRIAMVFQSYALYPHMNVYRNMAFGLKFSGLERAEIDRRVRRAADMLKLAEFLERKPAELSGGQRQRTAIGRAIVRQPDVFLFDEPLSNLDAALRVNTRLEIAALHAALGTTMVYVTHDQVEAMTLADRIIVMNQGRVEQAGTPLELYRQPRNLFVAGFIGAPRMNLVTGKPAEEFGADTLGVRPEHLSIAARSGDWTATVTVVEHLGSDAFIHADAPEAGKLIIRAGADTDLVPGSEVKLTLDRNAVHRFDAHGVRMS
jgi:multiple sugar transport system ATP-binding protein